ncbi:MAG: SLC13 family permease [bacterium JZ-2024 1]
MTFSQVDPSISVESSQGSGAFRRKVALLLGFALFFLFLFVPMPGISLPAHRLSAVLALVITFWVGEAIPIPVTALVGVCLCVLLGIAPAREVFSPFADPIIFLFIGSFILAEGLQVTGLDRRIAFAILSVRWVSRNCASILVALGLVTAFISMWVSNTATTAAMYPIALGILRALRGKDGTPLPTGLATATLLLIAYSASIGGIGTPVGSPPNLIGIGMIARYLNTRITFLQWMLVGIPVLLLMFLVLISLLWLLKNSGKVDVANVVEWVRDQRARLGKLSRGEFNCIIAFGTAVGLWLTPGVIALIAGTDAPIYMRYMSVLPEGVVALLAASLLFFLPVDWKRGEFTVSWKEAVRIDWGTILLFGGGLSLGNLVFHTGLAGAIGKWVLDATGANSLWTITAVAIGLGILISETTSNTASATMAIPMVIALANAAGVNGIPPALGACLGSSFGFMLPVSTPPNAIVYSSGLVPITRMVRAGLLFDLCGFFLIWALLRLICPVAGWA